MIFIEIALRDRRKSHDDGATARRRVAARAAFVNLLHRRAQQAHRAPEYDGRLMLFYRHDC